MEKLMAVNCKMRGVDVELGWQFLAVTLMIFMIGFFVGLFVSAVV